MNPIAKLHFRRQRLYDELCQIKESCNEREDPTDENETNSEEEDEDEEEKEIEETRVSSYIERVFSQ